MVEKPTAALPPREINIEDAINIFLKWKWVIMFFSLTVPLLTLLMMLMIKPEYSASSTVTIKSSTPESETLSQSILGTTQSLDPLNEELFIKSSMVLSDVVRELNYNIEFTKKEKFADLLVAVIKGRRVIKDFPMAINRINLEGASKKGVWVDFYTYQEYLVTNTSDGRSIGVGKLGEPFQGEDATFIINDFPHKVHDRFLLRYFNMETSTENLANSINVDLLGKKEQINFSNKISLVITVRASSENDAKELANIIALVYMKRKLEEAGETISQVLRFIEDQMESLRDRTEKSITNVESYKEGQGLYFVDETAKSKLESITRLDLESGEMELQVTVFQNVLDSIQQGSEITSKQVMMINSTQTPVAGQIATRINDLQLERKALERKYTPQHPDMLGNQGKLEEARRMLIEALESHVELLRERIDTNRKAITKYGGELAGLNEGMRNINRLQRVSDINERLLTYLIRRNEESKIQKASIIANVKIVRQATEAILIKPQSKRYILSGIMTGILVGIGFSVLLESMDTTIKSPSWIERDLALPVFGVIPSFFGEKTRKSGSASPHQTRQAHLIMKQEPKSMIAEAYRALRTNIQFASVEKKPKVLLLTSPAPKEGKSTTVANLGITMASIGSKVLILDCDLRKPIMHRFFNVPKENGISEILSQGIDWKDGIKTTDVANCFLITSGAVPPNPSELLGSSAMKNLITALRSEFDFVLIDTSPIIPVSDALPIAPETDAVFLIFELNRTTELAAAATVAALRSVHITPTGAIINNVRPQDRPAYGYQYGYKYGYGYRGYGYAYRYRYYKNYDYNDYYSYYSGDEKPPPPPKLQVFINKLLGRKEDASSKDDSASS